MPRDRGVLLEAGIPVGRTRVERFGPKGWTPAGWMTLTVTGRRRGVNT